MPIQNFETTHDSFTGRQYTNINGKSSVGPQLVDFYFQRKALIDLKRDMFFGQLADTTTMPKHMGKTIKLFHYIPLLDDRNINDQGINAAGVSAVASYEVVIKDPVGTSRYFADVTIANAVAKANAVLTQLGTGATITANAVTTAPVAITSLTGWTYEVIQLANPVTGNLYGSSRDIGTITGKLPVLSENGGRVNRVGFTRVTLEGSIQDFGFFDEYTEDSVQFDSDADLMSHISRETLRAANEISEDLIQKDLINGAGVVMFGGTATSLATLDATSTLTYDMLIKMDTILNNNRCPKDTKIITGSRMVDTKTVPAARYAFIAPELKTTLMKMVDYHNQPAFIPVQQYAAAGTLANGEIGSVGNFRFIENQWMLHKEGVGASADESVVRVTDGKADAYPVLVVGSGCFTTIGFQTSGDSTKFKILHKAPGATTADRHDPYGKTGFYSIQWWYGSMVLRPEWLACIWVAAPY